jgi:hypothetical protein
MVDQPKTIGKWQVATVFRESVDLCLGIAICEVVASSFSCDVFVDKSMEFLGLNTLVRSAGTQPLPTWCVRAAGVLQSLTVVGFERTAGYVSKTKTHLH